MSFFLIRLLQHFSHMELDLGAQAPDARPPPKWANDEGHRGKEKVFPKTHLTLYVLVRIPYSLLLDVVAQVVTDPNALFPFQGGLWVKMTEAERDA